MRHTMIILDSDKLYATRTAQYINNREGFPFEARVYESLDDIPEYDTGTEPDIALIDEDMIGDLSHVASNESVLILSGRGNIPDTDKRIIYKYQSCENIVKEILLYASSRDGLKGLINRKSKMKVLVFFSPIAGNSQTALALALGRQLSKTHRTLYVSLDCYSDLEMRMPGSFSCDLSDLMYSMNNDGKDTASLIGGASLSYGGLDVMPPMIRHSDLISISCIQWRGLLRAIEEGTDYEYVMLDMSKAVQGLTDIISMCHKLIITALSDKDPGRRIEAFKAEIRGIENIEDNTIVVIPPVDAETDDASHMSGQSSDMNNCARELAGEIVA